MKQLTEVLDNPLTRTRCPAHGKDFEKASGNPQIMKCPEQGCVHFVDVSSPKAVPSDVQEDEKSSKADVKAEEERQQEEARQGEKLEHHKKKH